MIRGSPPRPPSHSWSQLVLSGVGQLTRSRCVRECVCVVVFVIITTLYSKWGARGLLCLSNRSIITRKSRRGLPRWWMERSVTTKVQLALLVLEHGYLLQSEFSQSVIRLVRISFGGESALVLILKYFYNQDGTRVWVGNESKYRLLKWG